jgi:predicted ester cyclase
VFPALEIEDTIAEGDRVVACTTWRGAREGTLFGVEPTNESVEFEAIDIVRIEDGSPANTGA